MVRWILGGCAVFLVAVACASDATDVTALVRQLESDSTKERDDATAKLSALELPKPPKELLAATESENPDVRARALRAMWAIRTRAAIPLLPRGEQFAARGEVDLFVAATATWDLKPDDDRLWVPAYGIGSRLFQKAGLTGDRRPSCPGLPSGTFQKYRKGVQPDFARTDGTDARPLKADGQPVSHSPRCVQSAGIDDPKWLRGLYVSRGNVRAKNPVNNSLILANGDFVAGNDVNDTIIVCDGDVTVNKDVNLSLVIARGKITVGGEATTSSLYATRAVSITKPLSPVEGLETVVVENEAKVFNLVTFFELHRVGLEAKVEGGAVVVSKVAAKSEAERAGAKAGDTVLAVGGTKPTDAEHLRRALRDALALGDAKVQLKRGTETLTVTLSLPE